MNKVKANNLLAPKKENGLVFNKTLIKGDQLEQNDHIDWTYWFQCVICRKIVLPHHYPNWLICPCCGMDRFRVIPLIRC